MTFGEKIRARRIELNMTMEDLGHAVGVQRSAINKYEKGMLSNPKKSMVEAFARALDVPVLYLLDEDPASRMELTQAEHSIIIAYRQSDESTRAAVRAVLHVEDERKTPASSAG